MVSVLPGRVILTIFELSLIFPSFRITIKQNSEGQQQAFVMITLKKKSPRNFLLNNLNWVLSEVFHCFVACSTSLQLRRCYFSPIELDVPTMLTYVPRISLPALLFSQFRRREEERAWERDCLHLWWPSFWKEPQLKARETGHFKGDDLEQQIMLIALFKRRSVILP